MLGMRLSADPSARRTRSVNTACCVAPPPTGARATLLEKAPNIASLPEFDAWATTISGPVLLKLGDNVSTDEILPAGAKALPYRSNIPRSAEFAFAPIDNTYPDARASTTRGGGHADRRRRQLRPGLEPGARRHRARATSACTR